jgi:hypothetical protein
MADIIREIKHDQNEEPVLILRKKPTVTGTFKIEQPGIKSLAIRLQDIWMYSEEYNPDFEQYMFGCTMFLCDLFGLGLATPRKMAEIATVIQEGIDDLVKLPPPKQQIKTVGECDYHIRAIHGEETDITGTTPIRDMVPVTED